MRLFTWIGRSAVVLMAALGLAACNGSSERAGQTVKDDVRGARDFLRDRGITIDTRLPER